MKNLLLVTVSVMATACGAENAAPTEQVQTLSTNRVASAPESKTTELLSIRSEDKASLPECVDTNESQLSYVLDEKQFYVCSELEWVAINIKGDTGETGAKGDKGDTGVQGLQGIAGVDGAQGIQGAQGAQGVAGVAGTNGVDGVAGAQGAQGVAGTNGTNGAQGAQGAQGVAGTNGTNGAQGAQGASGASLTVTSSKRCSVAMIQGNSGITSTAGNSRHSLQYQRVVFSNGLVHETVELKAATQANAIVAGTSGGYYWARTLNGEGATTSASQWSTTTAPRGFNLLVTSIVPTSGGWYQNQVGDSSWFVTFDSTANTITAAYWDLAITASPAVNNTLTWVADASSATICQNVAQ